MGEYVEFSFIHDANEKELVDYLIKIKRFEQLSSKTIRLSLDQKNKLKICTYAGTRINYAIAYWIKSQVDIIKIDEIDYRTIVFKIKNEEIVPSIEKLLKGFISPTENIANEWIARLSTQIKPWSYSKFSKFVPEDLYLKYVINTYYPLHVVVAYFKNITVN
jgi:hypothetical protein